MEACSPRATTWSPPPTITSTGSIASPAPPAPPASTPTVPTAAVRPRTSGAAADCPPTPGTPDATGATILAYEPSTQAFETAVDDGYVYWTTRFGGALRRVAKDGGAVTTLAEELDEPRHIALLGDSVYVTTETGLVSVPRAGGVITAIPGAADSVAAADQTLILTDWAANEIVRLDPRTNVRTTLASGRVGTGTVAVSGSDVLWLEAGDVAFADGRRIHRAPVLLRATSGAPTTWATFSDEPLAMAVGGGGAYVSTFASTVVTVPRGGGVPSTWLTGVDAETIVVDGEAAYFGDVGGARILTAAFGAATTTVLYADQTRVWGLSLDGASLYWIRSATMTRCGQIMKGPKRRAARP